MPIRLERSTDPEKHTFSPTNPTSHAPSATSGQSSLFLSVHRSIFEDSRAVGGDIERRLAGVQTGRCQASKLGRRKHHHLTTYISMDPWTEQSKLTVNNKPTCNRKLIGWIVNTRRNYGFFSVRPRLLFHSSTIPAYTEGLYTPVSSV